MEKRKQHQTERTNIDQLRDLFREFNNSYQTNFFIVKPKTNQQDEQ